MTAACAKVALAAKCHNRKIIVIENVPLREAAE